MKTSILKGVLFLCFLCFCLNIKAQVGVGTTTPDASSMLDIQSDTKGILIPRMLTSERIAIASPGNGLLVFDTDAQSFWFYNTTTWKELVSDSSLVDADGDTKIEVEKVQDTGIDGDEINFTTRNLERIKIGSDGEILMGVNIASQATTSFQIDTDGVIKLGNQGASTLGVPSGTESDNSSEQNYTKITTDGSLSYVGNATRWDDLKVPVNSVKIKKEDIDEVKFEVFKGGTAVLFFDGDTSKNKEESVMFTVQMPHGWKEETAIYPHVHWSSKTNVGSAKVEWVLEYTWATLGDTFIDTELLSSTTIKDGDTGDGVASAYEHVITPLGNITAIGKTLSSMLVCRLYRNVVTGSNDTFNQSVGLLEVDFHYQIDSDGSNQQYTKE